MGEHWIKYGGFENAFTLVNRDKNGWGLRPELQRDLEENYTNASVAMHGRDAFIIFSEKDDALRWKLLHGGEYREVPQGSDWLYNFAERVQCSKIEHEKIVSPWINRNIGETRWYFIVDDSGYVYKFMYIEDIEKFRAQFK